MIEAVLELDDLDGDFIDFGNTSDPVIDVTILNDLWAELGRPKRLKVTIEPVK